MSRRMHVSAAARGLNTTGDPWMSLAACRNKQYTFDQAMDSLDSGAEGRWRTPAVRDAKATCERCPVLTECRAWVLGLSNLTDQHGVIAGLVPQERRRMRHR